jgi:hypothetical protein
VDVDFRFFEPPVIAEAMGRAGFRPEMRLCLGPLTSCCDSRCCACEVGEFAVETIGCLPERHVADIVVPRHGRGGGVRSPV